MTTEADLLAAFMGGGGGGATNPLTQLSSIGGTAASGAPDINAFQRTLEANNPWNMAAAPVLGARFNTSTWSPNQTTATLLGQAFLGSVLKTLGQRDVASQVNSAAAVLPQLYANPGSVAVPEGVDPEAFGALKMTAMSNRQKTDEAMRQSLATQFGVAYDPATGTASKIPGADGSTLQQLMIDLASGRDRAAAETKGTNARTNASNVKIAKDIGGTISAIAALNDNADRINNLEGGDSYFGGVQRSLESLDPNSNMANYIKTLPFLADPLTVGLSGSSKQGTLNKTLESLHPAFGQNKTTLLDNNDLAKQAMIEKASKNLDVLHQLGYPLQDLQDLKDKLDAASSGTLIDNSYIAKRNAATGIPSGLDAAALKAEAADLAAQGVAPSDIAAQLRSKYAGGGGAPDSTEGDF